MNIPDSRALHGHLRNAAVIGIDRFITSRCTTSGQRVAPRGRCVGNGKRMQMGNWSWFSQQQHTSTKRDPCAER